MDIWSMLLGVGIFLFGILIGFGLRNPSANEDKKEKKEQTEKIL